MWISLTMNSVGFPLPKDPKFLLLIRLYLFAELSTELSKFFGDSVDKYMFIPFESFLLSRFSTKVPGLDLLAL